MELTTDYSFKGDETKFACTYEKLPSSVKPGSLILIADGSLVLRVTECLASSVKCHVENDQSIGERKNMNLPNVKVDLPVLQPKDIDDLQERPANPIPNPNPNPNPLPNPHPNPRRRPAERHPNPGRDPDRTPHQNFGVKRGVDFVAASFVQCAADIAFIRQTLGPEVS